MDLAFGPFSSLLTTPVGVGRGAGTATRWSRARAERRRCSRARPTMADHNVFDVSLPIADEMVPFVNWIASLPASQRPKTAAYPMADDPFADPPVQLAQQMLQALGVKTVYSKIFPEEVADYKAPADQVAAHRRADRGARLHRRADRVARSCRRSSSSTTTRRCSSPRRARTRAPRSPPRWAKGNADRDDGARRLVPRVRQRGEPGDGQGVRRQVRRHRVRRQRRRGRGLLGRPGDGRRR